jgi:tyrosine-specific transport protein
MTQTNKFSQGSVISGTLLISGTCIGGGMLGIPVMTSQAGFFPALLITTLSWLYMLLTGFLYLQATLWMPKESNLISMSQRFLGRTAKRIGASFFLLLYYCLLVAYISGITPVFNQITLLLPFSISPEWSPIITTSIFGFIIFLGARTIDRINTIFMVGLFLSYLLLTSKITSTVSAPLLLEYNWTYFILSAPILFSAFGFHNIIPSVSTYLKKDIRKLSISILLGTTIPFIIYIIWQFIIIGNIPKYVLINALNQGIPVTEVLKTHFKSNFFIQTANFFSIFALVTSLLGVAFSMVDFLSDGLKIAKYGVQRLFLCLITFIPPLVFSIIYPGMFIKALSFAGGFGESILNGVFPILMVWRGHYYFNLKTIFPFLKNKSLLTILLVFTTLIILSEVYEIIF